MDSYTTEDRYYALYSFALDALNMSRWAAEEFAMIHLDD